MKIQHMPQLLFHIQLSRMLHLDMVLHWAVHMAVNITLFFKLNIKSDGKNLFHFATNWHFFWESNISDDIQAKDLNRKWTILVKMKIDPLTYFAVLGSLNFSILSLKQWKKFDQRIAVIFDYVNGLINSMNFQ